MRNSEEARATETSDYSATARAIPRLAFAWIGLLLLTALASLCPRFTAFYGIYLLVTLGLASGSLAFLSAIYRKGKRGLHPGFKKFLGYGLALHYAAAALPRVDWAGSGVIGPSRVVYLFVLEIVCLAAGSALFFLCGRPAAYAGLGLITDEEARDASLRKQRLSENRKRGLLRGALEWVDALGFAAILVILIQTFVFQLYEIPSESMVPAFLKGDRPFTLKLDAGPRVPLTDWRLPFLRHPRRGDIITLANPRYPENQSVNLKKYLAQFVSMVTFTAVNIDKTLPSGALKADPLVKRVVGLPGEKLMMVDDVLYAERRGEAGFSPVEADRAWARTDLWKEAPDRLSRIDYLPIDESGRAVLEAWDAKRRGADPSALAASISVAAKRIAETRIPPSRAAEYAAEIKRSSDALEDMVRGAERDIDRLKQGPADPLKLKMAYDDLSKAWEIRGYFDRISRDLDAFSRREGAEGNRYALSGAGADDLALALCTSASPALSSALAAYAACPAAGKAPSDGYERSGRALNLLVKDNLLKRVAREAEIIASGRPYASLAQAAGLILVSEDGSSLLKGRGEDSALAALVREGHELYLYADGLYDARNFPPFPAGDEFLGPDQYFAMGDNRYNSLDFRYRVETREPRPLDPADPASAQYSSNINPFALDLRFIEGYAMFRIWPLSRVGAIH